MAAWPATLPNLTLPSAYQEAPQDQTVSSEMDAGPPFVRRRFSAATRRIQRTLLMTDAQLATFEAFWDTDIAAGALPIQLDHPRTGDAVDALVRPATYQIAKQGDLYWAVSFTLEVLP